MNEETDVENNKLGAIFEEGYAEGWEDGYKAGYTQAEVDMDEDVFDPEEVNECDCEECIAERNKDSI